MRLVVLVWANARQEVSHQEKNPNVEHPILTVMMDMKKILTTKRNRKLATTSFKRIIFY